MIKWTSQFQSLPFYHNFDTIFIYFVFNWDFVEFDEKYEKLLKVISKNKLYLVVLSLKKRSMKFSELMFETKLNPGVVNRNLKTLMDLGVVRKDRDEYSLTRIGERFNLITEDLMNILDKFFFNCWEYKNCGREPGGDRVEELGICSAATEKRLDGVHGGKNAGRSCWVVAGTFSDKTNCYFTSEYKSCEECDFYRFVKHLEPEFNSIGRLSERLRSKDVIL